MPKGFKGFQKGHASFLSKETYKKIAEKISKRLKGHPQWNTGRTHFKKGVSNNVAEKNPMWNGGRFRSKEGYIFIKKWKHPNCRSNGYIAEHRFIMSEYLGRSLGEKEIVHHKNGNKSDNRITNLQLMTHGEHTIFHCKGKNNKQRKSSLSH